MATVIDSLIVKLGIQSDEFKKGSQEVRDGMKKTREDSEKTSKEMEANGKRAASFFGSIRTELLALVGVTLSAQGIKTFITSMTSDLMRLGIESRALDMSAKSLDGWERAASAAGSTAQKMSSTLTGFQNALTNYRTGGAQDDPLFGALANFGAATGANFDFNNDSSGDIMRKVAQNWNKLSEDAKRRFGGMLGFDSATQQGLSSGALVRDADNFAKISRATDDATRKALEFNRRLEEMKQNFSAAAQVLYEALIPYVERLIPLIEKVGIWISEHGPEIEKSFRDISEQVNSIVEAFGGWETVLQALLVFMAGKWLVGVTGALGGVRSALMAISKISLIAGLVELQKYAEQIEKKYGWLVHNPVSDALNSGLGASYFDAAGKKASSWMRETFGFGFRSDDGYSGSVVSSSPNAPRGIRNNNPGNLNFAGQSGATLETGPGGRFAVFQSMRDGVSALRRQIGLYLGRGVNTIRSIISKYAPSSDGNDENSYVNFLSKFTGKSADEKISDSDQEGMFKLIKGIINHESGSGHVSDQDILTGMQVGSVSTAMRRGAMGLSSGSGSQTDINIQQMTIQSNASSVNQLGADVQKNVSRNNMVASFSSGQG